MELQSGVFPPSIFSTEENGFNIFGSTRMYSDFSVVKKSPSARAVKIDLDYLFSGTE